VGGSAIAWLIRRTHWWRGPVHGYHVRGSSLAVAAIVLLAIPVGVWFASKDWWLTGTGAGVAAVGIVGGFLRHQKWWGLAAVTSAFLVQFVAALVVLERVVVPETAREPYHAAAGAVLAIAFACILGIWLAPLALAAFLAGIGAALLLLDGDVQRAALLAAFGVIAVPVALFLIDGLRRGVPRGYKAIVLLGLAALTAGAYYLLGEWILPGLAGVALILAVTVLAIAIIHLVFLGAFALVWHPREHTEREFFDNEAQAQAGIAWRNDPGAKRPDAHVRRITNIVYPGAANPRGPIQQFVSEIFDSDDAPFFKNFLHMESKNGTLTIMVHKVTGEGESPSAPLAKIEVGLA
jgi:hypothetical protein